MSENERGSRSSLLLGLVPVVASGIVYWRIVGHFFWKDDFYHLYDLNNVGALKFIFRPFFSHLLITWKSIMVATHSIFDLDATAYFLSVLIIHLVNTALVYAIGATLSRPGIAAITAGVWGMSPVHMSTLGWYSVFGQVIATMFVLWIMLDLAALNRDRASPTRAVLSRWCVLLLAAVTSFGTGISFAMVFGLVVYLFLPKPADRIRLGVAFGATVFLVPILYFALQWINVQLGGETTLKLSSYLLKGGGILHALAITLGLWCYGISTLVLGPLLAGSEQRRAHEVVFGPLQGLEEGPVLAISCVVGFVAVLWIVWSLIRMPAERRRVSLALLVVTFSAYGIISLGRGASAFYDSLAKAALEGRYHYFATAPLALLFALLIGRVVSGVALGRRTNTLFAAMTVLVVACYSAAVGAADLGDPGRKPFRKVQRFIRQEINGSAPGLEVRLANLNLRRFVSPKLPGLVAIFIITYPENTVDGKRIYFEGEGGPELRNIENEEGRIADLIAPAD